MNMQARIPFLPTDLCTDLQRLSNGLIHEHDQRTGAPTFKTSAGPADLSFRGVIDFAATSSSVSFEAAVEFFRVALEALSTEEGPFFSSTVFVSAAQANCLATRLRRLALLLLRLDATVGSFVAADDIVVNAATAAAAAAGPDFTR